MSGPSSGTEDSGISVTTKPKSSDEAELTNPTPSQVVGLPKPHKTVHPLARTVDLPSQGILYGDKLPDGTVQMNPMTIQEEKIFLGGAADRVALIDSVLRRCLVTDTLPYEEYLIGDKMFMLMFLRSITYGPKYGFTIRCTNCGHEYRDEIELPDGLNIRIMDAEADLEPYGLTLPICQRRIQLRLLRVQDELEIRRYVKQSALRRRGEDTGDLGYVYRIALSIVSIDEEVLSLRERKSFCDTLIGGDSLAIRDELDLHDCGADLMLESVCEQCGSRIEQVIPFTAEFFRPKRSDVRRE